MLWSSAVRAPSDYDRAPNSVQLLAFHPLKNTESMMLGILKTDASA